MVFLQFIFTQLITNKKNMIIYTKICSEWLDACWRQQNIVFDFNTIDSQLFSTPV